MCITTTRKNLSRLNQKNEKEKKIEKKSDIFISMNLKIFTSPYHLECIL